MDRHAKAQIAVVVFTVVFSAASWWLAARWSAPRKPSNTITIQATVSAPLP